MVRLHPGTRHVQEKGRSCIMNLLLIAAGGCLGAIARFIISSRMNIKSQTGFPAGTLTVNLAGSFLLGWMTGEGVSESFYSMFGIGFMGAFTTFSTFKLENIQLSEKENKPVLIKYLLFSYGGGLLLAFTGLLIGMNEL